MKVKSIKKVTPSVVYAVTTSTGTFIADGLAHHNCYNCNINKSGNWLAFEQRLNKEKGEGFTDKLKARNESTKNLPYRLDWYEMYIKNYQEIQW